MTTAHEVIMAAFNTRLASITTSNGYSQTIKTLERARLTPYKGYDLPAVNFWSTGMTNANLANNRDDRTLEVLVEAHTKTWEPDEPFDSVAAGLAADVVTAINRDPGSPAVADAVNPKLGGIVSQCKFIRYDNTIGEGQSPWVGVLVTFNVRFLAVNHNMTTLK